MTHDETVAFLMRRQEKYDRRDAAALAADYAADGVVISPMFPRVEGTRGIEASYRSLFTVFPDWQIALETPLVDGDRAVQAFSVEATHAGDFLGVAGTGRRFGIQGALLFHLRDRLIARERRTYDFTGFLLKIGVLRSRPGPRGMTLDFH